MIKVSGIPIQNFPEGYEQCLDDIMMGEFHSSQYHFIKTPIYVFGRDIEEIRDYAINIKKIDSSYDTLFVYDAVENDDREQIKTLKLK